MKSFTKQTLKTWRQFARKLNNKCLYLLVLLSPHLATGQTLAGFPLDEIEAYVRNRFATARVEIYPFPHLVIEDILPPLVYQYLADHWPDDICFDKSNNERKRLPVTGGCAEIRKLSDAQKMVWSFFGEKVVNGCIKGCLIDALLPFLNWKFPLFNEEQLNRLARNISFFNSRMDGLHIDKFYNQPASIHVDQSYMIGAFIIYFPDDRDHVDLGTALYISKEGKESLTTSVYPSEEEFTLIKVLPYLPNILICNLQCPKGWHGVNKSVYNNYIRKSYFGELHLKPELVEELYPTTYTANYLYRRDRIFLNPDFDH